MPRSSRLLIDDQPTVYHVMSRTCLDGYPLGGVEKDHLVALLKRFAGVYFCEVLGFCVMGNHFHFLIRMLPRAAVGDSEVVERYKALFGEQAAPSPERISAFRDKWTSLSEMMREIKQSFSRFYNKRHGRRGFFWGGRFKSVIVENGRTLVNCLAYIDLNPVRAGIVKRPEEYRWCSLGYHVQSRNKDALLSLDLGLAEWDIEPGPDRLRLYREFVYRSGALETNRGKSLEKRVLERAQARDFAYTHSDRLLMRTRWFTDSAILGSRAYVTRLARKLGLDASRKRVPKSVAGLDQLYSFRRLAEHI